MAPGGAGSSVDVGTGSGKDGAPSHNPDDVRQKLQQTLAEDNKGGWDRLWQDGLTPWDLKGVTPAVAHLLRDDADAAFALLPLLAGKRVLVPGCGTGYDVVEFAVKGAQLAVGLDISASALDSARKYAEGQPGFEAVRFELADFFAYAPETRFDVIFDYTFFCAIHPSLRDDWGRKTAELLATPGVLLTLMFPIGDHSGGPPFAVSKAAYEAVLSPLGFVSEDLPTVSHPARQGKEQLVKWQRSKASSL